MLAEVDTLCNPIKIGLWKGPDTRSKCVVTMNPTQAGQSRAVGTRSAPPGLTEDIPPPKRGLLGPKRTLFACFLELGGSIWAITLLDEPGIPLQRSGHPTSAPAGKCYFLHTNKTSLSTWLGANQAVFERRISNLSPPLSLTPLFLPYPLFSSVDQIFSFWFVTDC